MRLFTFNLKNLLKKEVVRPLLDNNHKHFEIQKVFQEGGYTAFVYVPFNGWSMLNGEPVWDDVEYFICLNKHSDVCKYALNNLDTELETEFFSDFYQQNFKEWQSVSIGKVWSISHPFMNSELNFRINPKVKI
jgi:hypothetical protein